MYWYYRLTYNTSVKYVKTSNSSCEIYLKSDFGNKYQEVPKPYPIWDEPDHDQMTEEEFIEAIATIDLNFKMNEHPNQYTFNLKKAVI